MSLLDELQGLDLSPILNARSLLSGAIGAPGIMATVQAGPAACSLGDLGIALDSLRSEVPDAAALMKPLEDALAGLAGCFDIGDLPLGDLTDAIREGIEFIAMLASSVTGDPADFGKIFGTPLGQAVELVGDRAGEIGRVLNEGATTFAALSGGGAITAPAAIVDYAIEILLPVPKTALTGGKIALAGLDASLAALALPTGRMAGLAARIEAVAAATTPAALDAALADLAQARANTIAVLTDDLAFAVAQIGRLRPSVALAPLAQAGATLRHGRDGVIEFLATLRGEIVDLRAAIAAFDLERVKAFLAELAPAIEAQARANLEAPIDRAVEALKAYIRRKLAELPVRALRARLSQFLHNLAQSITELGLDAPAQEARELLHGIADRLDPATLTAGVQDAVDQLNTLLSTALDGIVSSLETIVAQIDAVAGEAEAILGRLAEGLAAFRQALDGIAASIEALGIEQVRDLLVDSLRALRETASKLLTAVTLPEPLRPQIEQLARLIESVDLDAALAPVRAVAEQLRVPAAVAQTVEKGLSEAASVIRNLLPAQLAQDLHAELAGFLDTLRGFDPAALLPDVSGYLEQAALLFEQLDPRDAAAAISGPFQTALDAFDTLHPRRLLAPAITAYDQVLASIPGGDGETLIKGLHAGWEAGGRIAGSAVLQPAAQAAGGSDAKVAEPPSPERQAADTQPPPDAGEIHAGDPIRLLGAVPARLREALMALEAGPAGTVMAEIDGLCAGLGRQVRALRTRLAQVTDGIDRQLDEALAALAPVQLDAQLSLRARWGGDAARLSASLNAVALVNPAVLREALAAGQEDLRGAGRSLRADAARIGVELDRLVFGLEATPLGAIGDDLDGLLAALDPEPIAAEIDGLVADLVAKTPKLTAILLPELRSFFDRVRAIINRFNPGAQIQKFVTVLDVVRDELELLDPRRLASELGEIHGAIRATLTAYDPRVLGAELAAITANLAGSLRALDPASLLGNLSFLQTTVGRLAAADPSIRLAAVGQSLASVGEELRAVDVDGLLEAVNGLGPRLVDSFDPLIEAVRTEIVALLDALRYASASGSVRVSGSIGGG